MRVLLLTFVYYVFPFASFINTYYGIVFYTFISVIRPEQLTWGSSRVSNVFLIASIILLVSCILKKEKIASSLRQPFFIYFALFMISLYFTTYISPFTLYGEGRGSYYYLKQVPQIFSFCVCLYAVLGRLDSKQIDKYLLITLGFITFMGVWGIEQYTRGNVGVEGLFGYDRCAVTSVYVLYFPLALYFFKKKSLTKLFGGLSMLVCFAMIILTQSRAGLFGWLVVASILFWDSRKKIVLVPAVCLLLFLGVTIAPDGYFDRFRSMQTETDFSGEIIDYSSASRLLLWKVAAEMIIDNPILGVGHLNFSKANQSYSSDFVDSTDSRLFHATFGIDGRGGLSHTHNTLLNIFVEGGLLSLIPFFMLFMVPMRKGYRIARKLRDANDPRRELIVLVGSGLAGFLVTGFFGNLMLVDFFYWNLTILYFLTNSFEGTSLTKDKN